MPPYPATVDSSITSISTYPAISAIFQAVSYSAVLSQIYNLPFPSLRQGTFPLCLEIKTAQP